MVRKVDHRSLCVECFERCCVRARIVKASNLVCAPEFKDQCEHLQKVEDFDGVLVGELSHWNAVIARIFVHVGRSSTRRSAALRRLGRRRKDIDIQLFVEHR